MSTIKLKIVGGATTMNDGKTELLNKIRAIEFMLVEFNLYLNSHPYDARAIMQYNCYVQHLMALRRQYNSFFGPLTAQEFSKCPWQWIDEPWPWEYNKEREAEI